MPILSEIHSIADSLGRFIVRCIQDSVGDDIKGDIRRNQLATTNSIPTRIWDLINTKISENASIYNCTTGKTQRGPWQMILVFDPATGLLLSIMREERYKQLCKMSPRKRKYHYATCLAKRLNPNLQTKEKQTSLHDEIGFGEDEIENENGIVEKIVETIFSDIGISAGTIRHHALVLFKSKGYEMHSARCIMVDGNFDVVDVSSWNKYITVKDSDITEQVDSLESADNNPSQGLRFTRKARERAGMRDSISLKKDEEEKKSDS